jgi:HSP20 family protein
MMFRTFDPFRELDRVAARSAFPAATAVAYDTLKFDDRYELRFDVPGIDPDTIDLTVDGRELTLGFERVDDVPEGAELVARRRPVGRVSQRLFLGEGLDAQGLDARYDHGVLTVVIPVAESAKPRRVAIGAGNGAS